MKLEINAVMNLQVKRIVGENNASFRRLLADVNILIVTAKNPKKPNQTIELPAVKQYLRGVPHKGKEELIEFNIQEQSYFLGVLGYSDGSHGIGQNSGYPVVLVECNQGTAQKHSATTIIQNAINHWEPDIVIMPGIAFGLSMNDHLKRDDGTEYNINDKGGYEKFGDILMATRILAVDFRTATPGGYEFRSEPVAVDWQFPDDHVLKQWMHEVDLNGTKRNSEVRRGLVVSGNTLSNSTQHRNGLIDLLNRRGITDFIGGEMEATGLVNAVSSSQRAGGKHIKFLFAKGISDVGDDEKAICTSIRPLAADASANFVDWLLMTNRFPGDNIKSTSAIEWDDIWYPRYSTVVTIPKLTAVTIPSKPNMLFSSHARSIENDLSNFWQERGTTDANSK